MDLAYFEELTENQHFDEFTEGESAEKVGAIHNRVIKLFSNEKPRLNSLPNKIDPKEPELNKENKIEKTRAITNEQKDFDLFLPEIIYSNGEAIEVEKVEERTLEEYIEESNPRQIEDTCFKVGSGLKQIHRQGWAVRDFTTHNLHVDEVCDNQEIYIVDAEYSKNGSNKLDQIFDYGSFIDSISHLEQTKYQSAIKGFREGYGMSRNTERMMNIGLSVKDMLDGEYELSKKNIWRAVEK